MSDIHRRRAMCHAGEGISIARDILRDVAKSLDGWEGQEETYVAVLSQLDRLDALQDLRIASEIQTAVKREEAVRAIGLPTDRQLEEWLAE